MFILLAYQTAYVTTYVFGVLTSSIFRPQRIRIGFVLEIHCLISFWYVSKLEI